MWFVVVFFLVLSCSLFCPPRWWAACAQKDSAESSAGTEQTCVEANPVSEAWRASQSQSPDASPVESVLIILSLRDDRDTSALSMVCSISIMFCKQDLLCATWRKTLYMS